MEDCEVSEIIHGNHGNHGRCVKTFVSGKWKPFEHNDISEAPRLFCTGCRPFLGWIQDIMQTGMPNPQRVIHIYRSQRSCGKVMFLHLSVSHSVHRMGMSASGPGVSATPPSADNPPGQKTPSG